MQHPPPPLTRWQQTWRLATVWLLGGLFWLAVFAITPVGQGEPTDRGVVDVLLLLDIAIGQLVVVLVAFRRRWPVGVAVAVSLLSILSTWSVPAVMLAILSLATRRRMPPLVVVLILNVALGAVHDRWIAPILFPDDPSYASGRGSLLSLGLTSVIGLLVFAIVALIGWNIGGRRELVSSWRAQAETADREQSARVAQARLAERARIAREMHDVMGHRLSLVAMHAGALAHRPDLTEAERTQSAEIVRDGAHQALEELRVVLGVLRAEDEGSGGAAASGTAGGTTDGAAGRAVEAPQPAFTDIPSLVAEVTSSGQQVQLEAAPDLWARSVELPGPVGRHAYRVVQEALTNARRHAPGTRVQVELAGGPQAGLRVLVRNPVVSTVPATGQGLGLPGMAERVTLAGGTFEAGVVGGDFAVRVWLPWRTT
ncbi:sensor histidine kinase [Ornithinimicrobium sp. LYQ92]|uniref:sensor histidine kinase n=1 Tax=Serinicoccus sp. LYQ92 TaxID=3378798 RepID=UPI003853F91C